MRHTIPHIRAQLLLRRKRIYLDGAIAEMKVWSVPKSARTPEGLKYSLVYIDSQRNRLLGYDNAEGKGHHKHQGHVETPFEFESLDGLITKFIAEVGDIRGTRHES